NVYKKVVLRDNVIVGMVFVNDIGRAGIIFYLMKNRVDVNDFKQRLLSEDFGLIALPEKLRKRMLQGSEYGES
ncbi:MAG: NAD(P)/FAD-dependent oxidoreductase, partial [Candidatus Bathyarchaeia archaeon]